VGGRQKLGDLTPVQPCLGPTSTHSVNTRAATTHICHWSSSARRYCLLTDPTTDPPPPRLSSIVCAHRSSSTVGGWGCHCPGQTPPPAPAPWLTPTAPHLRPSSSMPRPGSAWVLHAVPQPGSCCRPAAMLDRCAGQRTTINDVCSAHRPPPLERLRLNPPPPLSPPPHEREKISGNLYVWMSNWSHIYTWMSNLYSWRAN
jgi:hypothetical protein